jgi:hypothetical protein
MPPEKGAWYCFGGHSKDTQKIRIAWQITAEGPKALGHFVIMRSRNRVPMF